MHCLRNRSLALTSMRWHDQSQQHTQHTFGYIYSSFSSSSVLNISKHQHNHVHLHTRLYPHRLSLNNFHPLAKSPPSAQKLNTTSSIYNGFDLNASHTSTSLKEGVEQALQFTLKHVNKEREKKIRDSNRPQDGAVEVWTSMIITMENALAELPITFGDDQSNDLLDRAQMERGRVYRE